jgi:hypothetical protein
MRVRRVPTALCRLVLVVGLGVALALGVASSAQAANQVPNPGFETACGSVPCNWTALPVSTITRDTVNPHLGSASIAITSSGTPAQIGALSDCFSISPATLYSIDGWYRTTSTDSHEIVLGLEQFSDAACSNVLLIGGTFTFSVVTTGAWTFLGGQDTTDAAAHSAWLVPQDVCTTTCPVGTTVNFDDLDVSAPPLAVTVSSFSARRSHKGVVLRWRTGSEVDELGFNVYRKQGSRRIRVNRRLLSALGVLAGTSYSFTDRHAPHRALQYLLQDVSKSGARTWHGPVRVAAS